MRMFRFISLIWIFLISGCVPSLSTSPEGSKVIPLDSVKTVRSDWPKSVVLVGGCFDLLHYGHIQYLNRAKQQGDFLVVALEPDARICESKKKSPFHNQKQRAYNLSALSSVDQIIMLPVLKSYEDYLALVKDVRPSIIAITPDNPQRENLEKQAFEVKAEVRVVAPFINGLSSTQLKRYLMNDSGDRTLCMVNASSKEALKEP